jgi:RNase P/RNase MRP subunit p30
MREPKALAALASLFDIDEDYALNMISKTPAEMLIKNLKKRERQRNQNAG